MGLASSKPSAEELQLYQAKLRWYEETLEAIEAHEREAWKILTPGTARLSLYWIQMLLCVPESLLRIVFHAFAFLHAAAWLAVMRSAQHVGRRVCGWFENRPALRSKPKPLLAEEQLQHQQWRLRVYAELCPPMLRYNLTNPWEPYFADGYEVSVHRPQKPIVRGGGEPVDCFDCGCDCRCLEHAEELEVRYFRSSFFVVSGCRSFQCGSCLGPCVGPCCYSPCAGGNAQAGYCKACEPEKVRMLRWLHEAEEAKMRRTSAFFAKRPELMRPSRKLVGDALDALPPQEVPMASLLDAPRQLALTA
mmetsp:Transcript_86478/g.242058  ORF Transcript_86478/g.242058 Transcript_86478/m.242058 type:complete len:305 (-) Transcript_86478:229-1143(-)